MIKMLAFFCLAITLSVASSFNPILPHSQPPGKSITPLGFNSNNNNNNNNSGPLHSTSSLNVFSNDEDERSDKGAGTMLAEAANATEDPTINGDTDSLEFNFTETATVRQYNWKEFLPKGGFLKVLRWFITGSSNYAKQSDEKMQLNLESLARMLILLREYEEKFGMPEFGGKDVQRQVLADITMDLYNSGCPTWVLETVMIRVAEGLTGKDGVRVMLLPNRAFIYNPSNTENGTAGTDMFRISPGFYISRLGAVEQVAVRLASFASNTKSVERLSSASFRMPRKNELVQVEEQQSQYVSRSLKNMTFGADELAEEILELASNTYGLFFFLNNPKFQLAVNRTDDDDSFWDVEDSLRELFTRLAANEASQSMKEIYREEKTLYSAKTVALFRILSTAGACSMWFGGSFYDMAVSGLLAVSVAYIGTSKTLAFEERVLTEVVASMFVGFVAGVLAITWPNKFCFGSIAVAAVLDLMQGFKVVYAVIEVMSRNIVAGSARLLEGILFTGLISYSLKFGLDIAFRMLFGANPPAPLDVSNFLLSSHGISQWFYPLILPLSSVAWSGLFRPSYADLPLMAWHGMLAFGLTLAGAPLFVAAMCVTLSAGIISRFTGREALGNTLAGLYALVPGAYIVKALLATSRAGFIENVLVIAASIGLGGWTGTILCSPTILGKSSGFQGWSRRSKRDQARRKKQQAMLYF